MKFGEKIKDARKKTGLSQEEFAKKIGVSLRTVTNYETGDRYPKKREMYYIIADVLNVDINYLLTEDEAFLLKAEEQYGYTGKKQAQTLVSEIGALFSGGTLSEDDRDEMMRAIQQAYWVAKEKNKRHP
ncbi:MAG: helix-turn-helix domain-containing protein [Clostridiales bacterium]|nr:helix-turn-helix domain-containing protein [Clostridiales bacterium]